MRLALAVCICGLALAACTTSTAVLTWHDAWKAELAGDLDKAERGYAAAFELDPGLVGAECNRIRLLAAHPDRATQAQAALDKLMKAKAAVPEVAATSAMAALGDGNADLARKRLNAARKLTDKDRPSVHGARRATELRVMAAEGNFGGALATVRALDLAALATADRDLAAVVAWNAQDVPLAGQLAAENTEAAVWVAAAAADHRLVVARAEQLGRGSATVAGLAIVAWSHAKLGHASEAQTWLAQAQARDAADFVVAQVTAAMALAAGQPQQARDALAALVARTPLSPWSVWFNLGTAQLRLGDATSAHQSFARAAASCASCASAVRNRDALAALVGNGL